MASNKWQKTKPACFPVSVEVLLSRSGARLPDWLPITVTCKCFCAAPSSPGPRDGLFHHPLLLSPQQQCIFSSPPVSPAQNLHTFFNSKALFQSIHYLLDEQTLLNSGTKYNQGAWRTKQDRAQRTQLLNASRMVCVNTNTNYAKMNTEITEKATNWKPITYTVFLYLWKFA